MCEAPIYTCISQYSGLKLTQPYIMIIMHDIHDIITDLPQIESNTRVTHGSGRYMQNTDIGDTPLRFQGLVMRKCWTMQSVLYPPGKSRDNYLLLHVLMIKIDPKTL